ncbi:MAG: hypothetical protein H8E81_08920 [Deltaproteobacteria bacterium]|nr:hypothetical protein [Deltaproteobacteria bacterium]
MGIFITVRIDQEKCSDVLSIEDMVQVCPVNIFKVEDNRPAVEEENEDECTLCMLCVEAFPAGAIKIHKLYDEQSSDSNGIRQTDP